MKKLTDLINQFEPIIRDAFFAAIADIKNTVTLKTIVTALENGDVIAALKATGIDNAAFRPVVSAIETAFETGGVFTANAIRREIRAAMFRFDVRNSRAEKWLRDHSSSLVTRIVEDQLSAIRAVMTDGLTAGNNPRNIALDIIGRVDPITKRRVGGIVGLTKEFSNAVTNMGEDLTNPINERYFTRVRRDKRFDAVVRKAIDTGTKLTDDQIAKIQSRYADNLLKLRGDNIARTEALQSLNRSEYEALKQGVEFGNIKQSAVTRAWDSAGDDGRTRDSHLELDGQEVGLDEPFTTSSGEQLMHPGDFSLGAGAEEIINCRCRVRLKIDWIKNG